jgi:hypothetical protein
VRPEKLAGGRTLSGMRVLIIALATALVGLVAAPATAADRELGQIERQLWHDEGALHRLGIYLRMTNVARDAVEADVITRRGDVREVMSDRYGPKVRVKVIANRVSQLGRTPWDSWAPRRNGREIRIWWVTNSVYDLDHVRVREGRRRVVITVIERKPNGWVTEAAKEVDYLVHLRRPVWRMAVIDGATGRKRPLAPGPGGP